MSTITRTSLTSLFGLLLLCSAAVAQSQPQLIVTVESGTPTPDPITTGQTTSTTFNIALDAPQNVHQELQQDGADQSYTIQLTNDSGTSDGNPVSVTISGSTLKDDGRIGDFDIDFDRANSRVTISSHQDTGLLSSVGVVASFTSYGLKHINLDGSATIDGNTYNDDDGGRAEVTVVDFHVRADTNVDTNINANDDPTADSPGLFVALNTDDDDSNSTADREQDSQVQGENDLEDVRMVLTPEPTTYTGSEYFRWVKLSRDNTHVHVWRTNDKRDWNGNGGKILYAGNSNTWDLNPNEDPDSYAKWTHDKDSLFAEGNSAGSTQLTLELIRNNLEVALTDTLRVTVYGVELIVNEAAADNDDDIENDIVCRHSTSPAGRPAIPCRARVVGAAQAMTIYLENGADGGAGQLRFGTTAGAATNADLTLNLPAGSNNNPGDWRTFYVSGESESQAMRDAVIRVKEDDAQGDQVGSKPLTVLWVAMSGRNQGQAERPNVYDDWPQLAGDTALGVHTWNGNGEGAIEIRGSILPSDFDIGTDLPVNPTDAAVPGQIGTGRHVTVDLGFIMERTTVERRIYLNGSEVVAWRIQNEGSSPV